MGMSPISLTVVGLAFISTSLSSAPSFTVPPGSTRFCTVSALTTSTGERPRAVSLATSKSIITDFCLPPKGYGIAAPGTSE